MVATRAQIASAKKPARSARKKKQQEEDEEEGEEDVQVTPRRRTRSATKTKRSSSSTPKSAAKSRSPSKSRKKAKFKALASAPPPWHSVALLGLFTAIFAYYLPSLDTIDDVATVDTFTKRSFPDLVSIGLLGTIRALIAGSIWVTSFHTAVIDNGWQQTTTYLEGSKLKMVPNTLSGIKTMMPFTSWAWNLLGASFTLSAYIALKVAFSEGRQEEGGPTFDPWTLRCALLLWEISAPFTLLVAAVVRYAIWPGVLKAKESTNNLKHGRNVMMHNMNVLFAVTEQALLGGVPVLWRHVSLGPLVGCAYVLFSWCMTHRWNDSSKHGPQFIYFFFDTTIGRTASIALVVLLLVLMGAYGTFVVTEEILTFVDGGVLAHFAFVALVCAVTMRFRD